MSFDSICFLSCFLPVCLAAYWLIPGDRGKNALLLILGLVFYAFGSLSGVAILLVFSLVNFALGVLMRRHPASRVLLALAIGGNLGFLFLYKYLNFLLQQVLGLPGVSLAAPLGISFYVFKSISYLVDVRREPDSGARRFPDFLLYLSFFPQVVSGPIARYGDFAPQLHGRRWSLDAVADGGRRFLVGLAKKVLLSSAAAGVADSVFALEASALDARLGWLGALAYCLQIYFDFSGYSDMAIGLSGMLGFSTPENFNYPYLAASLGDFWRRWHISLSSWFRDYVYIPLGGNRRGKWRTAANKAVVFLLCGLWHGSGWTFLIWGAWHALFSAMESLGVIRPKAMARSLPGKILAHVYTLAVVCVGFVIFRAESEGEEMRILSAMFTGFSFSAAGTIALHEMLSGQTVFLLIVGVVACLPVKKLGMRAKLARPLSYGACLVLYVLCIAALASGNFSPFIYAQF